MPVSKYFNTQPKVKTTEQSLLEDLMCEAIRISGVDIYYIPRSVVSEDDLIFGENISSLFDRAYIVDMYLINVDGHEGDGDFFTSFGVQIRDLSNFLVAARTFNKCVPSSISGQPVEGDLIFVPFLNKLYEIRFVEHEHDKHYHSLAMREPYLYNLRCEAFRYSHERLVTGVPEVDSLEKDIAYAVGIDVNNGSGNFHVGEVVYQGANLAYATAQAEVKSWDGILTELQVINIVGTFANASNIVGATSNTRYNVVSVDIIGDYQEYDLNNNKDIQTQANTFLDLSENNPFGVP
jgi:hypothetical protein